MNGKAQLIVRFIIDLIIAKGDIANRQIIKITTVSGFKSGNSDLCIGIQLFCNTPGNAVQLHTVKTALLHTLRQKTEEVSYAHGRLQNIALTETHLLHGIVNRMDHRGAGVMCVQGRSPGSRIFLRCQNRFQFQVFRCPVTFVLIKSICKAAPADIPGKDFLLIRRSRAVFFLTFFQKLDCHDVGAEFLLRPAFTQVFIGNAKVCSNSLRFRTFRLVYTQPFHYNIIRQFVLFGRINSFRLRCQFR